MAKQPTSTSAQTWASLTHHRQQLLDSLTTAPANRRDIEARIAHSDERLLELPAPDLPSAIFKLERLWDFQLHGLDADSRHKCLIIDDLRRLSNH